MKDERAFDHLSDGQLIACITLDASSAHREAAFEAIYDRHNRSVLRICASLLSDDLDAAETAAAEAFTTAYQDLIAGKPPREPEKLQAWLCGIAKNRCRRELRERGRHADLPDEPEDEPREYEVASRRRLAEVDRILGIVAAGFTESQQRIYQLSTRQNLRGRRLADALGVGETEAYDDAWENKRRLREGFGAYVLAREGRRHCAALAQILDEAQWNGDDFTKVLRARILRHMGTCKTCGNCAACRTNRDRLVRPFAPVLLPIVAAAVLGDRVLTSIRAVNTSGSAPPTNPPPGPTPVPPATHSTSIPGTRSAPRLRRLRHSKALAVVAPAVLIIVVAVLTVPRLFAGSGSAPKPAATLSVEQVSQQLVALAPGMTPVLVRVGDSYEAATYDQHGHIEFWSFAAAKWHQMGKSTYPPDSADGPSSYNERGVTVSGALLTGMRHATFIVQGPFTGDATGQDVAYTAGTDGWGYLDATSDSLNPVGKGTTDTTGVYFAARFAHGELETDINTGVFDNAFGSSFPLRQDWRWVGDRFTLDHSNIFTAQAASVPSGTAPPLPSASPLDGTYGALLEQAADGTAPSGGTEIPVVLTVLPVDIKPNCAFSEPCSPTGSATITINVSANVTAVFPVATSQTVNGYITGPMWAIVGFSGDWNNNSGITNLWTSPSSYNQYGQTPWYIPSSLGVQNFAINPGELLELTFQHGTVTRVQQLPF